MTDTALPDPRPGPQKDAALVQAMFDRVAPRYDLANTVLSFGQDRHWRRVAVRAVDPRAGQTIVDVAAGTGALSNELRGAAGGRARVVAVDFSYEMLAAGARRLGDTVSWVNADGTRLPLPDGCADAVTIAFGLRNLPDAAAGLREMARVARPGAKLAVLEFSTPSWAPFAAAYDVVLTRVLPAVAKVVTSDPRAYDYLAASIAAWPGPQELADTIAAAGWARPRFQQLTGGIVALHTAVRDCGGTPAAPGDCGGTPAAPGA